MGAKIGAVFFFCFPTSSFHTAFKICNIIIKYYAQVYTTFVCVPRTFTHFVNHRAWAIYVQAKTGGQGILVVAYLLQ